ncbi:MAG: hypothetical protein K2X03_16685 [Bryobacteraceae bacterium]|nr:hypothetical protein [Bryobacteraceae bacterium]
MIAILPLLLVPPFAADVQDLLHRASEEAEMFQQNITLVVGQETLKQRAQKRGTRFRPSIGQAAPPPVNFQTRELQSEYAVAAFAESNGGLHEVRRVTRVDGREIQKLRDARLSLAMGMKSPDDTLRRKMLLEFEKHGLIGTAVDFGLSLLLFRRQAMLNYTFVPVGTRQLGTDTALVVRFQQKAGEGQMSVYEGNKLIRQQLQGEIWLSATGVPLRIELGSAIRENGQVIVDIGVTDYAMSQYGFVLPVTVVHTRRADGQVVAENVFQYQRFQKFAADSELKFEVQDPPK